MDFLNSFLGCNRRPSVERSVSVSLAALDRAVWLWCLLVACCIFFNYPCTRKEASRDLLARPFVPIVVTGCVQDGSR